MSRGPGQPGFVNAFGVGSDTPYLQRNPNPPPLPAPAPVSGAQLARGLHLTHPDLLDPALSARFGATEHANRISLRPRELRQVDVTVPTIVVPLSVVTDLIYYQAKSRPAWVAGTTPGTASHEAPLKSIGPGVCLLSNPGTWFLWANQSSGIVECALVPASDGGMVARYLAEPGAQGVVSANTGQFATATKTVAANRDRKCLIIQNSGGGGTFLRVGVGYTPTYGVPPLGAGVVLGTNGVLTLSGDSCWKGEVVIAGVVGQPYEVVELV